MNGIPQKNYEKSVIINALRQRNQENFKNLGLLNPNFTIKFAYVPKHREDMVISMFPRELESQMDMYLELTDGNNNPLFDEPVLFKLRANPFYKQGEYELIPPDPSRNKNSETYLIPVSELEVVAGVIPPGKLPLTVVKQPKFSENIPKATSLLNTAKIDVTPTIEEKSFKKEEEDAHYSEMTIRDIAAILLKKPFSNKKWLNTLIIQSI